MKNTTEYIAVGIAGCIYTIYSAILTTLIIMYRYNEDFAISLIFSAEIAAFFPLGLFFVFMVWLSKRKPEIFRTINIKTIAIHLIILLSLMVFHAAWQVYSNSLFFDMVFMTNAVVDDFVAFSSVRLLVYGIATGLISGVMRLRDQKRVLAEESELRLQLQKTKLKEIELKLNPEIIYPNLEFIKRHAISDPKRASKMVVAVGKLLRLLVNNLEEESISVKDDLEFFTIYFKVVQLRLGRKLMVDENTNSVLNDNKIPSLVLLVPLFEELIFGKFSSYTSSIDHVIYKSDLHQNSQSSKLHIELFPVQINNGLEGLLEKEFKIQVINSLLKETTNGRYSFSAKTEQETLLLTLTSGKNGKR